MTPDASISRSPHSDLRRLPSMGALLEQADRTGLLGEHGAPLVKACLDELLAERRKILRDSPGRAAEGDLAAELLTQAKRRLTPSYRRILNATGTVLHTNLGRAPLGDTLEAVARELTDYSPLEYDLQTGQRGSRGGAAERLIRWLTGAPSALVVNNCAAALVLLLAAHARGGEVIVSRGELVEIGGGFRLPEILELSGAQLVEVGTTNRTRIEDFRRALTPETALILTTHSSNFAMVGFTESPTHDQLLDLGREHGIPVAFDLGSGMLSEVLAGEPSVAQAARFPLAAFSGDKLLGGPQCGLLIGSTELVEVCRRHPFYRAFRCGKVTLALLEETLRRHAKEPRSVRTVALLSGKLKELKSRAEALRDRLAPLLPPSWSVEAIPTAGQVGGGSLPLGTLESWGVALHGPRVNRLSAQLRQAAVPVLGRLEKNRLVLDLLAVPPASDQDLFRTVQEVFE